MLLDELPHRLRSRRKVDLRLCDQPDQACLLRLYRPDADIGGALDRELRHQPDPKPPLRERDDRPVVVDPQVSADRDAS